MHAQTAQYFLFNCRSKPRRWENLQTEQLRPCSGNEEMLQLLKCFGFFPENVVLFFFQSEPSYCAAALNVSDSVDIVSTLFVDHCGQNKTLNSVKHCRYSEMAAQCHCKKLGLFCGVLCLHNVACVVRLASFSIQLKMVVSFWHVT